MDERKKAMEWGQEYLKKQVKMLKKKLSLFSASFTKHPNCPRAGRRRAGVFDPMVHKLEQQEEAGGVQAKTVPMLKRVRQVAH